MTLTEAVVGVLFTLLAAAAVGMLVVGGFGMVGALRFVRCEHCDHLWISRGSPAVASCPHCRHEHLLHPVHAWHDTHPGQGGHPV